MLSEQDKKDMLADAASIERRDAFRKARKIQEDRPVSGSAYFDFLDAMSKMFPKRSSDRRSTVGADFRL
jgi:hypothetical protein